MVDKNTEAKITCPFFIRENRSSLVCEGVVDETQLTQHFMSCSEKALHMKNYCNREGGMRCPVYRAVNLKYYK